MNEFDFDFAVLLTLLTAVTGVIWALDRWWLGPRRREPLLPGAEDKPGAIVDFGRSFFPVILIVLLLRSFVAEPFRIPSGSMIPTLSVGDFILVNKFTYGFREPVFNNKFLPVGDPQRGDVAVFRYPRDTSQDYIKRIVGLPGDRIAYRNKQLFVNGAAVPLQADGVYTIPGSQAAAAYRYREDLGSVNHHIIVNPERPADDFEFEVPDGEYFAMGDNRDGSSDSRVWGTVPERNLVGRAFFVWMSWDGERHMPAWSRIGHAIH